MAALPPPHLTPSQAAAWQRGPLDAAQATFLAPPPKPVTRFSGSGEGERDMFSLANHPKPCPYCRPITRRKR